MKFFFYVIRSVEMVWHPFNGISTKEAFEAIIEAEVDIGEWEPKKDKVWLRLINKKEKAGKYCYFRKEQ